MVPNQIYYLLTDRHIKLPSGSIVDLLQAWSMHAHPATPGDMTAPSYHAPPRHLQRSRGKRSHVTGDTRWSRYTTKVVTTWSIQFDL